MRHASCVMRHVVIIGSTVAALLVAVVVSRSSSSKKLDHPQAAKTVRSFGAIQPRLSADGTRIVFSYQGAIWRMPRAGGEMTRLTAGEGFDIEPAWSPDGKRIAFINSTNMSGGELKLIEAETGRLIMLPKRVTATGKIAFHADEKRILGNLRADSRNFGLAWFDIESGATTTVATPPRRPQYAASHDGKHIVYANSMDVAGQQGGNDGSESDIWTVSSTGGKPKKIVRFPSRIHDMCWSANDAGFYVVTDLGDVHYDLWHVPLEDSLRRMRKITFGQADEHRPSVSRDGRFLCYLDNQNSCTQIVVRDSRTGSDSTAAVSLMNQRRPTGQLKLVTIDATTGKRCVARVSLKQDEGKFHAPVGSLHRVLANHGHFYCDAESELIVPAGKYSLRAFHGPEFLPTQLSFDMAADGVKTVTVELKRWTHAAKRGWYSGENHIHANYGYGEWYNTPETMLRQGTGEDLDVCNFMVVNSDMNGVFDREFFRGRPDSKSTDETILYWNQEFRSTIWGHMTLVNLSHVVEPVFTGFKGTTNPWDIPTNSDVADRAHLQNGLVNYTHVAQRPDDPYQNPYTGKGIPIDVALGKIDTLDINASYAETVPLWYRLLNCGFHLPASAGTDCFLNRIRSRLPGGDRVYVQAENDFSYEKWIAGLRAGKSFVSNGPMLELAVAGKGIGDTIQLPQAGEVKIEANATAQFPLDKVEVVFNGSVIATGKLNDDQLGATIAKRIKLDRSGWLALRASGPGHPDHPVGGQYAHTSPIYVQVGHDPAGSKEDAQYFLKWIDRLSLAVRVRDRIPSRELRERVRSQFERARAVYSKIARQAE